MKKPDWLNLKTWNRNVTGDEKCYSWAFRAYAWATILTMIVYLFSPIASASLFVAILAHLILSVRIVGPDEIGVLVILGMRIKPSQPGPELVPWLISELLLFPKPIQQMELPGEPEKIWRGRTPEGREAPIPQDGNWVYPIRLTTEESDPKEDIVPGIKPPSRAENKKSPDLLTRRATVEGALIVRYQITNPWIFLPIFGDIENLEKQLTDSAPTEMANLVQVGTLARTLSNMDAISSEITRRVNMALANTRGIELTDEQKNNNSISQLMSEQCGFKLIDIKMKPFNLGIDFNEILQKIPDADAKAYDIRETGSAEADARNAMIVGEKKGLEEMEKLAGTEDGRFVIQTDLAGKIASAKPTIVAGDTTNIANALMQLGAGTASIINKQQNKDQ